MKFDTDLFIGALNYIENTEESLSEAMSPEVNYLKFKSEINTIINEIDNIKNKLFIGEFSIINKMYNTAGLISAIDPKFFEKFSMYIGEKNSLELSEMLFNMGYINNYEDVVIEEFVIDYFLTHGNDKSFLSILFKQFYPYSDYCSYTGNFEDLTDFQNIIMNGQFSCLYEYLKKDKVDIENKNIYEIAQYYKDSNPEVYKKLLELCAYGFNSFSVIEVAVDPTGKSDFSALVFSDKNGDYMTVYNSTEINSLSDYSYDGAVFLENLISDIPFVDKLNLDSLFKYCMNGVIGTLDWLNIFDEKIDTIQFNDDNYRNLACDLTEKYASISKKNSRKMYINGYSLGGTLAEYSLNYLIENYPEEIGKVVVFNGLNGNLTDEEIERMKLLGKDKFKVILNEGDVISQLVNRDNFRDYAIVVENNWEQELKVLKEDADYRLNIDLPNWLDKVENGVKKLNYIPIIFNGAHCWNSALDSYSFDQNGNLNTTQYVTREEILDELFKVRD